MKELSFDPTKAKYFDLIAASRHALSPSQVEALKKNGYVHHYLYLFPIIQISFLFLIFSIYFALLFVLLIYYSFVATSTSYSFGDIYHTLHNEDLPVYITADSILHAFHIAITLYYHISLTPWFCINMSYDAILTQIEKTFCIKSLKTVLIGYDHVLRI